MLAGKLSLGYRFVLSTDFGNSFFGGFPPAV